ncbi:hypothetical protein [Beijerinckia indica]|uniref:hypothetical protein n=1 Tax=Beijerinckia indica TaxID=533 RepID=UPI0005A01C57|nr:hypothetical protein [Beijerinckia indica]
MRDLLQGVTSCVVNTGFEQSFPVRIGLQAAWKSDDGHWIDLLQIFSSRNLSLQKAHGPIIVRIWQAHDPGALSHHGTRPLQICNAETSAMAGFFSSNREIPLNFFAFFRIFLVAVTRFGKKSSDFSKIHCFLLSVLGTVIPVCGLAFSVSAFRSWS